jgi:hypothetical protein
LARWSNGKELDAIQKERGNLPSTGEIVTRDCFAFADVLIAPYSPRYRADSVTGFSACACDAFARPQFMQKRRLLRGLYSHTALCQT